MKIYINIYGIQNTKYIETNPQEKKRKGSIICKFIQYICKKFNKSSQMGGYY